MLADTLIFLIGSSANSELTFAIVLLFLFLGEKVSQVSSFL